MTHGCSVISGSSAGEDGMVVNGCKASTGAICLGLHSLPRAICWECNVQDDFFAPLSGTQPGLAERTEDWLALFSLVAGCMMDGPRTRQLASLILRIPSECSKRPRQKLQDCF